MLQMSSPTNHLMKAIESMVLWHEETWGNHEETDRSIYFPLLLPIRYALFIRQKEAMYILSFTMEELELEHAMSDCALHNNILHCSSRTMMGGLFWGHRMPYPPPMRSIKLICQGYCNLILHGGQHVIHWLLAQSHQIAKQMHVGIGPNRAECLEDEDQSSMDDMKSMR